jgi:3'-phosphoadenosine 5'-phosphosulfate sulfotransferase (PAPS reductase)/FAD synthetase
VQKNRTECNYSSVEARELPPENVHTAERLKELQSLPLNRKIQITQSRIIEWYNYWNGQVYVSFSGGKDSTVLLHIARQLFPDIEAVYVDTGLEYPELREFVKTFDNVTWLKPAMNFRRVIEEYGYPLMSKDISRDVGRTQKDGGFNSKTGERTWAWKFLNGLVTDKNGNKSHFNKEKWAYLVNAPFKVSNKCCDIMKKNPAHKYAKSSNKKSITGMMTIESTQRKMQWLKVGCNAFDNKNPQSNPMSFWTEQDVLEYCINNKIQLCSVYGNIVKDDKGKWRTTGLDRSGCVYCGFGCHLEKSPNRFERLKITHPKIWDYCIRPKDKGGLGMGEVLDFINVPYGKEECDECNSRDCQSNDYRK